MVKRISFIFLIIFAVASAAWAVVELDTDNNGALDVSRGGTNATTAAAAREAIGAKSNTSFATYSANRQVEATTTAAAVNAKLSKTVFDNYTSNDRLTKTEAAATYATQSALSGKADAASLGTAAAKNVGTTSGTVAAGDHGHTAADVGAATAAQGSKIDALVPDSGTSSSVLPLKAAIQTMAYRDYAQLATQTVTGGTLYGGGPVIKNGGANPYGGGNWNTSSTLPQSLTLDFGGTIPGIYAIAFNSFWNSDSGNMPKGFTIETSADAVTWTTQVTVTNHTATSSSYNLVPGAPSARYVRLTITEAQTGMGRTSCDIANLQVLSNAKSAGTGVPIAYDLSGNASVDKASSLIVNNTAAGITSYGRELIKYTANSSDWNMVPGRAVIVQDDTIGQGAGVNTGGRYMTFGDWIAIGSPTTDNGGWGLIGTEINPVNRYGDDGYSETRSGHWTVGIQLVPESHLNVPPILDAPGYNATMGLFLGRSSSTSPAARWHNGMVLDTDGISSVGTGILMKGGSTAELAPAYGLRVKGYANDIIDLSGATVATGKAAIKLAPDQKISDGTVSKTLAELAAGGGGSGAVGSGTTGQFAYYGSNGTAVAGRTLAYGDIPYTFNSSSVVNTAGNITLVGDNGAAGNRQFYKTSSSGVKAWSSASQADIVGLTTADAPQFTNASLQMATDTGTSRPVFQINKSRVTGGILQAGDKVGSIFFSPNDGASYLGAAGVEAYVEGSPASGSMPTRLEFVTGASSGTRTTRLKIDSAGVSTFTGQVVSTVATGTPPLVVASTTEVANLKSADSGKLNGQAASYYAPVASPTFTGTVSAATVTATGVVSAKSFTEGTSAASGTAITVSLANGSIQRLTTTGPLTVTLPTLTAGQSLTLNVCYGGAHTLAWAGATVKWPNGVVPTATSASGKCDKYVFDHDGTDMMGGDGGRNY